MLLNICLQDKEVTHRDSEPSEVLRIDFFLLVLDKVLSEMRRRFSEQNLAVTSSLESIIAPESQRFFNFTHMTPFLELYGQPCRIDSKLLEAEMMVASGVVNGLSETQGRNDLKMIMKLLSNTAFPNLNRCIQIALTIPATSASCERSFSAMTYLKNFLKNSTGDERLNDAMTVFVHKSRSRMLDPNKVVQDFTECGARRLPL